MNLRATLLGSSGAYANPVHPLYFADPFVFQSEGLWHAFGTGPKDPEASWGEFKTLSSPDLVNWTPGPPALKRLPEHDGCDFWAPEAAFYEGRYFMYYSVGRGDKGHHLRVATSSRPGVGYEDAGRLTSESCPFAIDASPYQHTDGSWWLFYATDLVEGERPGTVLVVDRLMSMTELEGSPRLVARASADWQRFEADRLIYGARHDWHTLEGPSVHFRNGRIWCLYSGGNWQNDTYGVDFVVAEHPEGPWENTTTEVPRTLQTVPGKVLGPGHNSVTKGPNGETDYIVYHAWNPERSARLMRIDPLEWRDDGPVCLGPTVDCQILR